VEGTPVIGTASTAVDLPRVGMLATVRNRRALITAVDPYSAGPEGELHLVTVEYTEPDGVSGDRLIWEREPGRSLLQPAALPRVGESPPMAARDFDALVRAARWSALTPYVDPDGSGPLGRLPVTAPLHGAVQVEDYQLLPLLMALRMPRVSLLLADDVGLGKTIEAGLVLTELLLRRRIRRVLVLCPASLRQQWRTEMMAKFSLPFDIVDRTETQALRRRAGLDANPWRAYPRIIASHHYLKQPDVLENFRATCRTRPEAPSLPWDLLIVDEAHNLAPAPIGEDSDLCRMLGHVAPHFEHRLFLTATPHNGYTRSFSGLLELLDPVRFTRTSELSQAERARVADVVVRRLKREINERVRPAPFADRRVDTLTVRLSDDERALAAATQELRTRVRALIAARQRGDQLAGAFAVEVLNKRLLSCPLAFADSWWRYEAGITGGDTSASIADVQAARRAVTDDTDDDREAEGRAAHAASTIGAWLRPFAAALSPHREAISQALERLGLKRDLDAATVPRRDGRWDALTGWIDDHLLENGAWRPDERLVLFTEYKTTLDHLVSRLRARHGEERVLQLYGGMDDTDREQVKAAFNDPESAVRILVATDAASEGLNLQETARYLIHQDIPWNPARLEQRNGRLDRYGQARDVTVWHFTSDDDADLAFMAHVAAKVEAIREDLGSTGEVFDAAVQRRLVEGEDAGEVESQLDAAIEATRGRARFAAESTTSTEDRLGTLRAELDLDPDTLRATLETALGVGVGLPRFEPADVRGWTRLVHPLSPRWQELIDDTLRIGGPASGLGALPRMAFDPKSFVDTASGHPVFRQPPDARLLHLGHPLYHRALALLGRERFPSGEVRASCWTVRSGDVPPGADALLLVTVEEIAVNELRETFHHWVRTHRLPVRDGDLGSELEHVPARELRVDPSVHGETDADEREASAIWDEVEHAVARFLRERATRLHADLEVELAERGGLAIQEERNRYESRLREVSRALTESSLARLEREIEELEQRARQSVLFDELRRDRERLLQAKEEELDRRRRHYEELREQLVRERDRTLQRVLPLRHRLRDAGSVRILPVTVEIRLPRSVG
jgi:superfamily II DNA or RNA helicase